MFGIGTQEILIILVIALLVIGPKRLPEVAKLLGKGYAQIKRATDSLQESVRMEFEEKRNEELRKKYPHLAVEDEKKDSPPPAPAAGTDNPPPADPSPSPDKLNG